MKKSLCVLLICLGFLNGSVIAATETKKVCLEQQNPKTKKVKQVCKEVKQHKKLEGTKVPAK